MIRPTEKEVNEFLHASNAIEGVFDQQSFEDAKWAWGFLLSQGSKGMNPFLVMQVHEILLRNPGAWSDPFLLPKYLGVIRDCSVYIGGHAAMNSEKIPAALEQWCAEMNGDGDEEKSKRLHVEYEKIHPFVDGNGRTGRMFMNWFRLRNNMPLLIIHADYADPLGEQREYYSWFKQY